MIDSASGSDRALNLRRLLAPRHIAVVGGRPAAEVARQCQRAGFTGEIWPVHPRRDIVAGLRCYPDVAALPAAPDAAFVAVAAEATVAVTGELARRGAGGVVCYASGFAEVGGEGIARQRRLVEAAGTTAVIGPNCYGVLNYLDGAALWPDQHGGQRVERGVAIVTQSGNVGVNLTMQRRSLPLAYLVAAGNCAGTTLPEIIDTLLDDERVTAIGLHLEGLDDVAAFSRVATRALRQQVPLVALKSGSSELGARTGFSHTSTLAGPDRLYDALFTRLGVARVADPATLVETLKLLSVHGPLPRARIASASCSGGEASLVADLAQPLRIELPPLPPSTAQRLSDTLGERVTVANPLDYHTYVWGDEAAQAEVFEAFLTSGVDLHLLVLDLPRPDRCAAAEWETTLAAFIAAHRRRSTPAAVVSTLAEGLPEHAGARLIAEGIAPMQGIRECLEAVAAAASIGTARPGPAPAAGTGRDHGSGRLLDEWESKQSLAAAGLPVPAGGLADATDAATLADALGYPVVVKAVGTHLPHKTEAGAVHLNLGGPDDVRAAVLAVRQLSTRLLVERMVPGPVAELVVAVHRDRLFGPALTLGIGGVLVELLADTATLLLPASRTQIEQALRTLRGWPLLAGHRGRPGGDVTAALDAIEIIAGYAERTEQVLELEVNPLLVLPAGEGAVAADALLRLADHD